MAPGRTRLVFDDALFERLCACCDVLTTAPMEEFDSAASRALLAETDILVTGWGCPFISREVMAAAPRLRLIAHAAGSIKYLVDPTVFEAGIAVTNAVTANAVPVAEYTLATIILANKRAFAFRDRYRADPTRTTSHALMDEPIGNYRRTVGIVGASTIGRLVIELLAPFDFEVLLFDPFVSAADPVARRASLVDLDTLFSRSDVISLHAPALPSTRAMVGARQLGLMPEGATLINTARGSLVDEAALVGELKTGRIFAVIDVTDPEVADPSSPLYTLPNVFLTPHIAGAIGTERLRLGTLIVEEIERFVAGEPLRHALEPALLERLA